MFIRLSSIEKKKTDDRKQFQCVNTVLKDKSGPLVIMEFD